MLWRSLQNRARRWLRSAGGDVWYSPAYRLPAASIEATMGLDPRRADLALEYLLDSAAVTSQRVRNPERIGYDQLARVHTDELLQSLHVPERLAEVFGLDVSDVHVDEILKTVRLACGGTLAAARQSLTAGQHTLNLLGGFHHAGPSRAAGLCPVNDVAVAVAALRAEGFTGRVVILDLDAHPPDGLAECFALAKDVWIGSLSGSDWGPLPGVDETVLPLGSGDLPYLDALDALLARAPRGELAFVLAGGDVLSEDRAGGLALTLEGAAARDQTVFRALARVPTVWVPGGGYSREAWKVLATTGELLAVGVARPVPRGYDSLGRSFERVASSLSSTELGGDVEFDVGDILADLGYATSAPPRLLGFYTREGVEYALHRYGLLSHLQRLGYGGFEFELDQDGLADRLRVFARYEQERRLLSECVLERQLHGDQVFLYVRWLTLRDPRGRFSDLRPGLPGQEEPGLGLAREAGQLLRRAAERLGLDGVAFEPAYLHTAQAAHRAGMRFVDPTRQGRLEALLRDLGELPPGRLTRAVDGGEVRLAGAVYRWEAGLMASGIERTEEYDRLAREEAERSRFTLDPPTGP